MVYPRAGILMSLRITPQSGVNMILPFEELIENEQNAYEFTVAVTRRAYQLAILRTPEVEKYNGKVVSLGMQQIFARQVEYRFIE
ncbi:MAG TPA: hypothetical protein VLH39_04625 [Magnetospirillaceae bacterium]|nr:hypothetical protein [Magnetospirillaceae bacterium]